MRFLAFIAFCLLALVAFSSAANDALNCPCPRNLEPVCGSDSRTYPNACELNCAAKRQGRSLSVARKGEC